MDAGEIIDKLKTAAASPAGKIALLGFGGFLVYRFVSGTMSGGSSAGASPARPSGGGSLLSSGAVSSPAAAPSLPEQLQYTKDLLTFQTDIAQKVKEQDTAAANKTALFSLDLQKQQAANELAQQNDAAQFWLTDLAGKAKSFFTDPAPVSDRGRTPSIVAGGAGPTKFDLFYEASQRPIVDAWNRQQGALVQQQQFSLQQQTAQNTAQANMQQQLIDQQNRASNPFSSIGNFFKTVGGLAVSTVSLGRSASVATPPINPQVTVPPVPSLPSRTSPLTSPVQVA